MTVSSLTHDLDQRARLVFRQIVETYLAKGEPVGSRTLSRNFDLSPATLRNVMSDLEELGFLFAPHVSAGRLPTDRGLRYFIDGIMESGNLNPVETAALEAQCRIEGRSVEDMLEQAGQVLSGLSASTALVVAPKADKSIRHIEFVSLDQSRALVIIVSEDNLVENRIMPLPAGVTPDMLKKAGNFLSERLSGKTMADMRHAVIQEIKTRQHELGGLTATIIESGLALQTPDGKLIVRGRSHLLGETGALEDLDRIRELMQQLESKEIISQLLDEAGQAKGVKIYIGAENPIFKGTGHAMILTPYTAGASQKLIGAVGVIGPMRLDYAKVIPSVHFMAEMISRRISDLYSGEAYKGSFDPAP